MSSVQDKQAMLVNAIISANEQGKLIWETNENHELYTVIGDKVVYILEYHHNGTESIKIEVYIGGVVMESFIDDDLSSSEVAPSKTDNWFTTMKALLSQSQRIASKSDEILDSLLKDLGA